MKVKRRLFFILFALIFLFYFYNFFRQIYAENERGIQAIFEMMKSWI